MLVTRDIVEQHEQYLRQLTGIQYGTDLPEKLVEAYWTFKRVGDRIQYGVQTGDLIRLCVECGFGKPNAKEAAGDTVVELWNKQQIQFGQRVNVKWRNQKKTGKLVGVTTDSQCRVEIDGDTEERIVNVSNVTLTAAA